MNVATVEATPARLDAYTILALFVGLVALPVVWCTGGVGSLVRPIFQGSREHWWYFHLAGLAAHWIPVAFIYWALRKNGESWSSIGLEWAWFWRKRWWFAVILGSLVAAAFAMPGLLYGASLPSRSQTIFIAPVSTVERLMIIGVAITAGLTEEIIFRGFAFTRLQRVLKSLSRGAHGHTVQGKKWHPRGIL